ncbi:MAG: 30S ribosomal protein S6 [Candidatus Sungbacteria bacterium]|uniref:Small ribosomal subunit protein bS6 n=1 Tax=Candidatus Sungiibacteriota bacterium TaxID=2750080 RepID=A0A932VRJ2_9BACT|nr:30S ribosomal protein S6 [Candidatus Sungbacteria bacterium]
MDSEQKNYELAYLLSPALAEDAALRAAAKLTGAIEQARGLVKHMETPKKRRLAYPIRKETSGYFGWITFTLAPESVAELERKIKEESALLRYSLVEEEIETRVPYVRPVVARRAVTAQKATPPQAMGRETPTEEKLDLEALDKKLEEILGK